MGLSTAWKWSTNGYGTTWESKEYGEIPHISTGGHSTPPSPHRSHGMMELTEYHHLLCSTWASSPKLEQSGPQVLDHG